MFVMTKEKQNLSDSVDYQNTGPKMIFLSHVRVCYRLMAAVVKAMHTASKHSIYKVVCSVMFKCA